MIGGWAPKSQRNLIKAQCEEVMNKLPLELKAKLQKPYAPRATSSIAQGCAEVVGRAMGGAFQRDGMGTEWHVVERSPEAGRRKWILREAAGVIDHLWGQA